MTGIRASKRQAPSPNCRICIQPGHSGNGNADCTSARFDSTKLARLVVGILVAAVVLSSILMAYVPATAGEATFWAPGWPWPVTTIALFKQTPRPDALLLDEEIYLGTLQGVERGVGFYQAQNDMLNANPGRWITHSPLTYRQPLLTYFWLFLGSGALIGFAYGLLAGISMLVAYQAVKSLVRPLFATLTPLALGVVYTLGIIHPPRLLYVEMWAAPFLVTTAALCALVLTRTELHHSGKMQIWVLSSLGATVALFAMSIRELSVIPVVFMFAALLLDRVARARYVWIPLAASLIAYAALYAVHANQVWTVSQGDPVPLVISWPLSSYFHPGLGFLSACVRWVSTSATFVPVVLFFCIVAIAGAWTLKRPGFRVLVWGNTIGLLVLLVLTGTPVTYLDGSYTGYWGFLFLPPVISWAALGFRLFPGASA